MDPPRPQTVSSPGERLASRRWRARARHRVEARARVLASTRLLSAPGNPGLEEIGSTATIDPADPAAVIALAVSESVDLVVIGPEAPLAAGVADALCDASIPVFGPIAAAARLETSKTFAKDTMRRAGVPTGGSETFAAAGPAHDHLAATSGPYVVKADGLAAGKGVLVTSMSTRPAAWVDDCFSGRFGAAGNLVVIEEFLGGDEISVFGLCDGTDVIGLRPARDYKRLADGDRDRIPAGWDRSPRWPVLAMTS